MMQPNLDRQLPRVYAPDQRPAGTQANQGFHAAIVFYKNYLLTVVGHFDDRVGLWTPIVDLSSKRDGRADVKLVTGKSFSSKKHAENAGIEMAKNWIDVFNDL
jgi:hypothetical protein